MATACNPGDPAVVEENELLRAELEKVKAELARSQGETEIAREQLAKAASAVRPAPKLPSPEEVRSGLDRQQSEFRKFLGELHPGYRIDRVWHEGLEMPDPEQPIRTRFVYFMTGPDGKQQSGQVPAYGDLAGNWSFGEFTKLSVSTIIPPQIGESGGDPETEPEETADVEPEGESETKTLEQIRQEVRDLAKAKSKDGIKTHVILFDTPLNISGAVPPSGDPE
jgi:hypothetical protein